MYSDCAELSVSSASNSLTLLKLEKHIQGGLSQHKTFSLILISYCFPPSSQMTENFLNQLTSVPLKEREKLSFSALLLQQFLQFSSIFKYKSNFYSPRFHAEKWIQSMLNFSFEHDSFCYNLLNLSNFWNVSSQVSETSHPDFMLFCRFHHGPAEHWERTRRSTPANHPLTYGSGERCVCVYMCVLFTGQHLVFGLVWWGNSEGCKSTRSIQRSVFVRLCVPCMDSTCP